MVRLLRVDFTTASAHYRRAASPLADKNRHEANGVKENTFTKGPSRVESGRMYVYARGIAQIANATPFPWAPHVGHRCGSFDALRTWGVLLLLLMFVSVCEWILQFRSAVVSFHHNHQR